MYMLVNLMELTLIFFNPEFRCGHNEEFYEAVRLIEGWNVKQPKVWFYELVD